MIDEMAARFRREPNLEPGVQNGRRKNPHGWIGRHVRRFEVTPQPKAGDQGDKGPNEKRFHPTPAGEPQERIDVQQARSKGLALGEVAVFPRLPAFAPRAAGGSLRPVLPATWK